MIKALFFDIDGTLVSFNTHAIPPTTIEAIAAAQSQRHSDFYRYGTPRSYHQQPFCIAGPWINRRLYNHERRILFRR